MPDDYRFSKFGHAEGNSRSCSTSRGHVTAQVSFPGSPGKMGLLRSAPPFGMYTEPTETGSLNGDPRFRRTPSSESLVNETPAVSRYLSEELLRRQQHQQDQSRQQQHHLHHQMSLSRSGMDPGY